jgi:hypothetical protein
MHAGSSSCGGILDDLLRGPSAFTGPLAGYAPSGGAAGLGGRAYGIDGRCSHNFGGDFMLPPMQPSERSQMQALCAPPPAAAAAVAARKGVIVAGEGGEDMMIDDNNHCPLTVSGPAQFMTTVPAAGAAVSGGAMPWNGGGVGDTSTFYFSSTF